MGADDYDKQVVAKVNGEDVTHGELMAAFDKVANKENWKLKINALVGLNGDEVALVREAVIFFTGSVPSFTPPSSRQPLQNGRTLYRVKAAGYYSAIGA